MRLLAMPSKYHSVIPAQAGFCLAHLFCDGTMDSRLRGNEGLASGYNQPTYRKIVECAITPTKVTAGRK